MERKYCHENGQDVSAHYFWFVAFVSCAFDVVDVLQLVLRIFMESTPFRQLVPPRRYISSSSSSDGYEDSIGPLPALMRNDSLVVRRTTGSARISSRRESGQMFKQESKLDYTSDDLVRRAITRMRSIDTPLSHYPSTHRSHLIEASVSHDVNDGLPEVPTDHLPCLPRQTLSLQATHSEQYQQVPNRVSSVQTGAARPKRPDPPELILPVITMESCLKEILVDKSSNEETTLADHFYHSKRPGRTVSTPVFGRLTVPKSRQKLRWLHKYNDPIAKSSGQSSTARPSHSIAKSLSEGKEMCNDVWVERIIVRDGKPPEVYFKSVFSRECKCEPPTGALVSKVHKCSQLVDRFRV